MDTHYSITQGQRIHLKVIHLIISLGTKKKELSRASALEFLYLKRARKETYLRRASGLLTSLEYLSPVESVHPPRARRTFRFGDV